MFHRTQIRTIFIYFICVLLIGCGSSSPFTSITLGEIQKSKGGILYGLAYRETITVKNCNNPLPRNDSLTETKTVERTVSWNIAGEIGGDAEASVIAAGAKIEATIASGYELEVNDALQRSRTIDLPVDANSSVAYIVEWKPIIWSGILPFTFQDGQSRIEYQYEYLVFGEVVDFIDKTSEDCENISTIEEKEIEEVITDASQEINKNWTLGELLYEENFEDEVITRLNTKHGHFEIVEVDGNHIWRTSTSSLGQISLPTTSNDYAFEVKIMQVSGEKGLGFVEIRKESGTPCDSGYAINLDVQGGWLNLLEREKTCDELRDSGLFANTNITLSNGVWYTLRIEAKGAEVRVYLNDKLILEDTDIDDTVRKSNTVSIATCCGDLEPFIFDFDEIKAWELAP